MSKLRAIANLFEKLGEVAKGLGSAGQALGSLREAGVELADAFSPEARVRTIEVQAEKGRTVPGDPDRLLLPSQLPPTDAQFKKVEHDSVATIEKRLQKIIALVQAAKRRADFQQQVARVLNRKNGDGTWQIPEKDHVGEIKAIFAKVRSSMRYMMDPRGIDTYRAPRHSMKPVEQGGFGGGDCDDFTSALAAMLETAGYPTKLRVVSVKPDPAGAWSHILVMVGLNPRKPTKWSPLILDPRPFAEGEQRFVPLDASVAKPAGWYPKDRISGFRDFPVPE